MRAGLRIGRGMVKLARELVATSLTLLMEQSCGELLARERQRK